MRSSRTGFALLDVIFATLVFGLGGLAAAGLMIRSVRIARNASELRTTSTRMAEVSDSLMWTSGTGAGARVFADGKVRWTSTGALLYLEGWGGDTTGIPIAELWAPRW